jgi:two-component system, NtrC family, nitrogen regulation sensor histidine kinase NtrY
MNQLATGLLLRIGGLLLTSLVTGWGIATGTGGGLGFWLLIGVLASVWQAMSLYGYLTGVNRKLTRFLESVQYADFSSTFRADNGLGPSFRDLNRQFNAVLDAFRQARAETEASEQFLQTIVQHVTVGLLVFDGAGNVALVNQAALRLLGLYRLRHLTDLAPAHPALLVLLDSPARPDATLYLTPARTELSVRSTAVRLRGRLLTVVSVQNIHSELQQKELEAWQNLTSVLRHEIMNSITPIVSLVGTMRSILDEDLFPPPHSSLSSLSSPLSPFSPLQDLHLALSTIETRGRGIMQFVDAYRHFTTIPLPNRTEIPLVALLSRVETLVRTDAQNRGVALRIVLPATPLTLLADASQIEMVLLNLIRNALDSLTDRPDPVIIVTGAGGSDQTTITVSDNGPGIEADALERIFIPFFTTRQNGSGIGLSVSRQIMQAHGGQLMVTSVPGQGSTFTLLFA